jgi:hypothetical protein
VSRKRNINFANIVAAAVAAGLMMIALWQEADPRGFVIFVVLLAIAEVFVQFRWRLSVACKSCGFDPILYLKDPALAAAKVKAHLDRRSTDVSLLLARPLNLPSITPDRALVLVQEEEKKKNRRGGIVSRSV